MQNHNPPHAHALCGSFAGVALAGVQAFLGVPYARAPMGALRFQPPQDLPASTSTTQAQRPSPTSPQFPSRLSRVMGECPREGAEDSLRLSIWTPAADGKHRPVVIWLHGGAFMTGSGDLAWYDGERLAREGDVVVVGVNYRLGALGFLCGPDVSPGNLGLMDQAHAVQWVKAHISAFGGDPEQLTLMGQSAGGLSIALLLCAYPDLPIQRAIMMSAPLGLQLPEPGETAAIASAYAQSLAPATLHGALSMEQLLRAQGAAASYFANTLAKPGDVAPPFVPVLDGVLLPSPATFGAALAVAATRVSILIGTTRDESTAFFPRGVHEAMTQEVFEMPSLQWAERAAKAGRQAYVYRFDHAPSGDELGAPHCIELPFVFGNYEAFSHAPMLGGLDSETFEKISQPIRESFLNFIRGGSPSTSTLPLWPTVQADRPIPRMHLAPITELRTIALAA